jgi:hypothetical protein
MNNGILGDNTDNTGVNISLNSGFEQNLYHELQRDFISPLSKEFCLDTSTISNKQNLAIDAIPITIPVVSNSMDQSSSLIPNMVLQSRGDSTLGSLSNFEALKDACVKKVIINKEASLKETIQNLNDVAKIDHDAQELLDKPSWIADLRSRAMYSIAAMTFFETARFFGNLYLSNKGIQTEIPTQLTILAASTAAFQGRDFTRFLMTGARDILGLNQQIVISKLPGTTILEPLLENKHVGNTDKSETKQLAIRKKVMTSELIDMLDQRMKEFTKNNTFDSRNSLTKDGKLQLHLLNNRNACFGKTTSGYLFADTRALNVLQEINQRNAPKNSPVQASIRPNDIGKPDSFLNFINNHNSSI